MVHMSPGIFTRRRDAREPVFLQGDSKESDEDTTSDTELPLELAGKPRPLGVVSASGVQASSASTATAIASEVLELVKDFCSKNPPHRVAPTEDDLEKFWSQCRASRPRSGTAAALAGFEHGLATALVEQLGDIDCTHEWKPQLRALHVLSFLHRSGDLERRIAADTTSKAGGLLRHLAAEVPACKNEANKVMLLSKLVAELPPDQSIRIDEEGGVFFTCKEQNEGTASAPAEVIEQECSADAKDVKTSATEEEPMPKHSLRSKPDESETMTTPAEIPEQRSPAGSFFHAQLLKLSWGGKSPEVADKPEDEAAPSDEGRSRFWGSIAETFWRGRAADTTAEALRETSSAEAAPISREDSPADRRGTSSQASPTSAPQADSSTEFRREQYIRRPLFENTSATRRPQFREPLHDLDGLEVQFPEERRSGSVVVRIPANCASTRSVKSTAGTCRFPSRTAYSEQDDAPLKESEDGADRKAQRQPAAEHLPMVSNAEASLCTDDLSLQHNSASAKATLLEAEQQAEEQDQRPKAPTPPTTPLSSPADAEVDVSILQQREPTNEAGQLPTALRRPPAEILADTSTSPLPETAIETRLAPAIAFKFPVADSAELGEVNAPALSTLEAATNKAEVVSASSKHKAAALDDNFDPMLDVAAEKVGLPGALGLIANTVRTTPLSDSDPGSASRKQQKQVPYIPWGIELTLPPASEDPFGKLVDKSM